MPDTYQQQDAQTVFALDVGTRSIIGVVGKVEGGRLHVQAIEKENHSQRAMLDGQIEDIDQVASVARRAIQRLEAKLEMRLTRVCVAAAGRALKSQKASFSLEFAEARQIDDETISQLETGAVSAAEQGILGQPEQTHDRFYMVGYTAAQYRLDGYPLSTLKGHTGKKAEADVVATFLPQEVVDSLYAVVSELGLEVASLTLEPIASLNAAIPADIRLLNLALVDIGAGTSDIAVCQDGSVTGYTMATVAGDEITELLMKKLLVDFRTGEQLKAELDGADVINYTDILGIEHETPVAELRELVQPVAGNLAKEIAARILELNGKAPSAIFLAGGGSKLAGLRPRVAEELAIDAARVALAGNHFDKHAFSTEYDLKDPEYATPLGIAISSALGLINDSYVVTLNGEPAKIFRSGTFALRDILLMNGYTYRDLIGRTGANLTLTLNGERMFFRGEPATPAEVLLNGEAVGTTAVIHAGDSILFTPAKGGADAAPQLKDLLGGDFRGDITVNGAAASLEDYLHTGDVVWSLEEPPPPVEKPPATPPLEPPAAPVADPPQEARVAPPPFLTLTLNGAPLSLPKKQGGEPYFLMDLLEYSGLDFDNLDRPVELLVNGAPGQFSQVLLQNDAVVIRYFEAQG